MRSGLQLAAASTQPKTPGGKKTNVQRILQALWLSGRPNAFVSVNVEVNLRWARLLLGWMGDHLWTGRPKPSQYRVTSHPHIQVNSTWPSPGAVLGKNMGGGLAPHHLEGNNEQNYCVQLSSIKQLMHRNYPEKKFLFFWGDAWARFGGPVPPWHQPRTATGHPPVSRGNDL